MNAFAAVERWSIVGLATLLGSACAKTVESDPAPAQTSLAARPATTPNAASTAGEGAAAPEAPPLGSKARIQSDEAVCLPGATPGAVGYCARLGTTSFRLWGAVKSGKMPKALASDHAGKRLYSSNMGSAGEDGLSVYLTNPLRLERQVSLQGHAIELLVTNDDRALWVSDAQDWGKLRRFDTERWTLEQSIAVPGFPKWILASRDESRLFASLWALDGVSQIQLSDGRVQTSRTVRRSDAGKPSKNPRGMALSRDERELYVLNNHDHTVSVFDVETLKETARVRIGFAPRHIVAVPQRETFLVSLTGEDALVEWSPKSRRVERRYAAGRRPKTIATSYDGQFAYAANFVGNSLTIIDLASGKTVELELELHKPSGLAVRPDDHFVYVSGFCSNAIWAIERIEESDPLWEPQPRLGEGRRHKPCLTCASTFAGCPYPPGHAPPGGATGAVKSDAEWGWEE